jgi:hypothetical protein
MKLMYVLRTSLIAAVAVIFCSLTAAPAFAMVSEGNSNTNQPIKAAFSGYGGGGGGGGGSGWMDRCTDPVRPPNGGFHGGFRGGNEVYGTDAVLELDGGNADYMAISDNVAFAGALVEPYSPLKNLSVSHPELEGSKQVWVRFYNKCNIPTQAFAINFNHHKGSRGRVLGEQVSAVDDLIAVLKFGDKGADVKKLQDELKRLGFLKIGVSTTYYGPMTRAAVNAYLASIKPVAETPVADKTELDILVGKLKQGDKGTDVARLQELLFGLKFYPYTNFTGYYGPVTSGAVAKYLASK